MPILAIKDYIYLAAIIVLIIAFGVYTHHERSVGAAAVVASDQKAVQAQRERDTALQSTAALASSVANGDYTREVKIPVTDAPVPIRLCHAARSDSAVPGPAAQDRSGNTATVSGAADEIAAAELQRLTQFADSAVQIARDADAQVEALQKINGALRTEMQGASR